MVKYLRPLAFFGLATMIVASFAYPHGGTARPAPRAQTHQDVEYSACRTAQRFVAERLLAPHSAHFEDCLDVAVQDNAGLYSLSSYVDAENGFSADIRTTYTIALQRSEGEPLTWTLISLETR